MRKYVFLIAISLLSIGQIVAQSEEFEKIESKHFDNLYRVNEVLYRSEQPGRKGFRELEEAGVKTVINFRRRWKDDGKARGTDLKLERIPLKASELTEEDIIEVLCEIHNAEKPVLIHCWRGSDRTGVITAAYRVVFENWPKEKAINEFRFPDFGYHEKWYPNLVHIIEGLDTDKIKRELGLE